MYTKEQVEKAIKDVLLFDSIDYDNDTGLNYIQLTQKILKKLESAESSRNEKTIKLQIQATMPSHIDKELAYKYGRCLECKKWYGDCIGH